jgi:hypothetical protein
MGAGPVHRYRGEEEKEKGNVSRNDGRIVTSSPPMKKSTMVRRRPFEGADGLRRSAIPKAVCV